MQQPSRVLLLRSGEEPRALTAGEARSQRLAAAIDWLARRPRAFISTEGALRYGFADEGWWVALALRDDRPCGAAVVPPNDAWLLEADEEDTATMLAAQVLAERHPRQLHTSGTVAAWIAPNLVGRWRIAVERALLAMMCERPSRPGAGRRAVPDDLAQLARYYEQYREENQSPPRPGLEQRVRAGRVFVLDAPGGGIASALQYGADSARFTGVTDVYTFPAHRGRGYATELVALATLEITDAGKTAHLTVSADNPAAIRVYEKVGFVSFERAYVAYAEPR